MIKAVGHSRYSYRCYIVACRSHATFAFSLLLKLIINAGMDDVSVSPPRLSLPDPHAPVGL